MGLITPPNTPMISHRKIGGIHWFTIGRYRIAFCIKRTIPTPLTPLTKWDPPPLRRAPIRHDAANFTLWHNP